MTEKINVNVDAPEKIAELHGIGIKLAKKIVQYRTQNGFFRVPEDLAQVEGVGLNLALTLAPHINWQLPEEALRLPPEEFAKKLTRLIYAIVASIVFVGVIPPLYVINPSVVFMQGWEILDVISFTFGIMMLTDLYSLSRLDKKEAPSFQDHKKTLKLVRVTSIVVLVISTLMMSGLVIPNYFPINLKALLNPDHNLFANTISVILFAALVVFIYMPVTLILYKPQNLNNFLIIRTINYGGFLIALLAFWLIWAIRHQLSFLNAQVIGAAGVNLVLFGFIGIRKNSWAFYKGFQILLHYFPDINQDDWSTWVNLHVPNTEDQIALKQSLEKLHPGSRFQKFLSFVIIGIGGWFILTAIEAILELLVQDWFQGLIDKFR